MTTAVTQPVDGGGAASVQSPVQAPPPPETTVPAPTSGGGDVYDPSESSGNCCGPQQYVPAPTASAPTDPGAVPPDPTTVAPGTIDANTGQPIGPAPTTDGQVPPDPIATTNPSPTVDPTSSTPDSGNPAAPAAGPAASLPDWPTWQRELSALGVDASNIDRIGQQSLSNEQVALVYMTIKRELEAAGQTAGPSSTTKPEIAGGWSPQWEQKFAQLGLTAQQLDGIKQTAMQRGADDATLQQLYDQIASQVAQGPTAPGTGQVDPNTPTQQQPGWNQQWEAKFTELGMPASIVAMYAQSGAPESGLAAAYDFAAARLEDFKQRGWYDKFTNEKMPAEQIWGMILSDKELKDSELQGAFDGAHKENMSTPARWAQGALTFFPGGELLQYALGKKLISGKEIDRSNPMNMVFAGLSGLAAFTSVRGVMNLSRGWKAASSLAAGTSEIAKLGLTMEQLGLHGQAAGLTDAAQGAAGVLAGNSKLASLIPFTKAHQQVTGLAHLESAARAFNQGGAERLLAAGGDGAFKVTTLGRTFEDVMRGNMALVGSKNAYLGNLSMPFKQLKTAPIALDASGTLMTANRALRSSNGGQVLTGLLEAGGNKIAMDPTWIGAASGLTDNIAAMPMQHLSALGQIMAGTAAPVLGANVATGAGAFLGRFKPGVAQYFDGLARHVTVPEWYTSLTNGAAAELLHGAAPAATGGAGVAAGLADDAAGLVDDVIADGGAVVGGGGGATSAVTGASTVGATAPVGGTAGGTGAASGQMQLPFEPEQLRLPFDGGAAGGAAAATSTAVGAGRASSAELLGLKFDRLATNDTTRKLMLSGDAEVVAIARQQIDAAVGRGATLKMSLLHGAHGEEKILLHGDKPAIDAVSRAVRSALRRANSAVPA